MKIVRLDHHLGMVRSRMAIPAVSHPRINALRARVEYARDLLWHHADRLISNKVQGLDTFSLSYALDQQLGKLPEVDDEPNMRVVDLLSLLGEVMKVGRLLSPLSMRKVDIPYANGWSAIIGGQSTANLKVREPQTQYGGLGRIVPAGAGSGIPEQTWANWTGPYPADPVGYVETLRRAAKRQAVSSMSGYEHLEMFVDDRWVNIDQAVPPRNEAVFLRTVAQPRVWLWGWFGKSGLERDYPVYKSGLADDVWIRIGLQLMGKVPPSARFQEGDGGLEVSIFPSPPKAMIKHLLIWAVPLNQYCSWLWVPLSWREQLEACVRFFHYRIE